jgi:hypothetical protein
MSRRILLLTPGLLCLFGQLAPPIIGARASEGSDKWKYLTAVKDRPALAVDVGKIAQFKLGSRKKEYRSDELISLDLAILNSSNDPIFFEKIKDQGALSLSVIAPNGETTSILPSIVTSYGLTGDSFRLIASKGLLVDTIYVLADCNDKEYGSYNSKSQTTIDEAQKTGGFVSEQTTYNSDLFVTWGEGCLKLKDPGIYTITAEYTNSDTVIASSCGTSVKTAVGTITSKPLQIRIVK